MTPSEKIRNGYRELHATHPRVLASPLAGIFDGRRYQYVGEHRVVMAYELGRPLRPDEHVHHIDGNKLNNTPRNLRVYNASEHKREHRSIIQENHRLKRELEHTQQLLATIGGMALRGAA